MIYVMSGVRGDYKKYTKMLDKLRLSSRDMLFVLGNVIGGGDDMRILLDMMMRENVYPVLGENEFAALPCLEWLSEHPNEEDYADMDEETRERMMALVRLGCQQTMLNFRKLSSEQREMIVEYLSEFSLYEEIEAGGKDYILVFAGIAGFDPDKDIDDYDIRALISAEPDYKKVYFPDKYLVTAKYPTRKIYEDENPLAETTSDGDASRFDKIYIGNNHVALNCGSDIGGRMAALRLDDLKEYYTD